MATSRCCCGASASPSCAGHRAPIFAWRPAPVQVNWLGYPGSMHAPFMDYLVADPVVVPPGDDGWYDEQVIRLPGSYQVNDPDQAARHLSVALAELVLPSP